MKTSIAIGLATVIMMWTAQSTSAQNYDDIRMHRLEIGLVVLTALKVEQTNVAAGLPATRTPVNTLAKCGDQLTASCKSIIGAGPDPSLYAQDPDYAKQLYRVFRRVVGLTAIIFDDMFQKQGVAGTLRFIRDIGACAHHPFKDVEYDIAWRYFDADSQRGLARLAQCGQSAR